MCVAESEAVGREVMLWREVMLGWVGEEGGSEAEEGG